MLGYLLAPTQTHGLGDSYLRLFLAVVAHACDDGTRFDDVLFASKAPHTEVFLETPYAVDGRRRVVDIEVQISVRRFDPHTNEVGFVQAHRIAIENKIKAQAADSTQLYEEFLGVRDDLDSDDQTQVTMVFLTPPDTSAKLADEFNRLDTGTLGQHRKAWLQWAGAKDNPTTVVALIRTLLHQEAIAAISPVSEYLRHTLKAFARHILDGPAGTASSQLNARTAPELGDIVQVVAVDLGGTTYQIERYDSTTIRVYNTSTQDYEVAKQILRRANDEKGLGVPLTQPGGRNKNTRTLGRDIVRALIDQGKATEIPLQ